MIVPFRLTPLLVAKPWGGRRLGGLGRELPDGVLIGESWDVADLPPGATSLANPVSVVRDGPAAGLTLTELVAQRGDELFGEGGVPEDGRFPLLVKHLDAAQHLSVQVHPTAQMVTLASGYALKTESWVVIAADEGASLMLGVRQGTTLDDFRAAAGSPDIVSLLRHVPAVVGAVHHLPAGLVHALGAGVVVAEVQTPSDTTFRLYDWTDEYGRAPRSLHVDEAVGAAASAWSTNLDPPAPVATDGRVASSPYYDIDRHRVTSAATRVRPSGQLVVTIVLEGRLRLGTVAAGRGGVIIQPAVWSGNLTTQGATVWLDVTLPPVG